MKTYALIVAHDKELGIGKNNKLPWHINKDLKYFRELTTALDPNDKTANVKHNVVIMGRKTWESLPNNYQPLPNRINIVISGNLNYALPNNVLLGQNIEDALTVIEKQDYGNVFVIGGASIYKTAITMDIFSHLYVTEIEGKYNCDVFFPEYKNIFELIASSEVVLEENYRFSFKNFKRKT